MPRFLYTQKYLFYQTQDIETLAENLNVPTLLSMVMIRRSSIYDYFAHGKYLSCYQMHWTIELSVFRVDECTSSIGYRKF